MPSLLENLKAIRDGARHNRVGICANLPSSQFGHFLELAKYWPKCSGDFYNPVPGNYTANKYNGTLWQGEQLQLRLELLDFVIGELENDAVRKP